MATKANHLAAIKAMRLNWSAQDSILAIELAGLRYKLERERAKSARLPATVLTAAGGEKPNPVFGVIDSLVKQEAALTRRLGLNSVVRNASDRYSTNDSPTEKRAKLWAEYVKDMDGDLTMDLIPGHWWGIVCMAGCQIEEDGINWPNGPLAFPMAGKVHPTGKGYPVSVSPPVIARR